MSSKSLILIGFALGFSFSTFSQSNGISPEMLEKIKQSYENNSHNVAIHNAIANNDINKLAVNNNSKNNFDNHFSIKVNSKGITDQKSSGRCWLFSGLNVFRAKVISKYGLNDFQFSQVYPFFWDQLEKSNLFLQGIIDTRTKPFDDKMVEWLFKNPLSDGGQFTGVSDILSKYGVVPSSVMVETYSSNNTNRISQLISWKLKEFGLRLREASNQGANDKKLLEMKTEMLSTVYRMLALSLGEPPTSFTWTLKDSKGNPVETKTYTPKSFYEEFIADDLENNYVMLMNDPTREYYKLYEIDFDRHRYDGKNWTYVNLPIEDIKQMAIASLKDSTMMYFSCDVGKFFDRERGLLDVNYYDYGSLMGTTFGMNKKERVQTFASGSSHAMTLMAVDIDPASGAIKKWMVENSWGPGANGGHLILTDEWFNEYMFRLVVEKKYTTEKVREILTLKPIKLPAWDPMFADEL